MNKKSLEFKFGLFLTKVSPVLVSMLIIILGYGLIIQKNVRQYQILKTKELGLKEIFENKQHQVFNTSEYKAHIRQLKNRFNVMLKQFSEKNEIPGLLEEISKIGRACGLKFALFAPQTEVEHDFYVEVPINLSVIGGYFQLALFLNHLAQLSQIVTLHQFSIEALSLKEEAVVSGETLMMNITAKIYKSYNS